MLAHSTVAELISAYEKPLEEEDQPIQDIRTTQTVTIGGKSKHPLKGIGQAQADLAHALQKASPTLVALEKSTGLHRDVLVYGLMTGICLYLLLGQGAQFVSNLIGFAYPAYCSFKAIRTPEKTDDTNWLIYWCAFSTFYVLDSPLVVLASRFPIYWVLKTFFLVFLWLPQTQGALILYTLLVDPAVSLFDKNVKNYFH